MNAKIILLSAAAGGVFFGTLAGATIGADPKHPLESAWPHYPAVPDTRTAGYQFTQSAPEDLTPPWTLDSPHPLYAWQINTTIPDYVPKLAEYRPLPLPPDLTDPASARPSDITADAPSNTAADGAAPVAEPAPAPAIDQSATAAHSSVTDQEVARAVGNQLWSSTNSLSDAPARPAVNS